MRVAERLSLKTMFNGKVFEIVLIGVGHYCVIRTVSKRDEGFTLFIKLWLCFHECASYRHA